MSTRRALTGLLVTLAVVCAASACSGGGGGEVPSSSQAPSRPAASTTPTNIATDPPATEPSTAESTPPPAAAAFDGTVVTVEYAGGVISTAEPRVIATLGTQVRMVITSDVTEEVHVHGVDAYVDLAPGAPVTYDFTASIPGSFEVELHDSGELLFTLQVQP